MKLILFRHGIALDRELAVLQKMDDSKRPLTDKGREKTEKMARILKEWDERLDVIVSSPLVRAQQTAQILFQTLKVKDFFECPELVPSAPPQAFAQWLKSHAGNATSVLAVGHEPQLSVFASWALSGQQASFLEFKKSGMLCLEVETFEQFRPGSAELAWLVQPKLLLK
jgi:phosphohistidine phosphatase